MKTNVACVQDMNQREAEEFLAAMGDCEIGRHQERRRGFWFLPGRRALLFDGFPHGNVIGYVCVRCNKEVYSPPLPPALKK